MSNQPLCQQLYGSYETRALLDALVFIDPRTATAKHIGDELARREAVEK
jgi:hypothetical protein